MELTTNEKQVLFAALPIIQKILQDESETVGVSTLTSRKGKPDIKDAVKANRAKHYKRNTPQRELRRGT